MPFLQCLEGESPPDIGSSTQNEIVTVTGVGKIVAKLEAEGEGLSIFVRHEVERSTPFGDKFIMVKYMVHPSWCGEQFIMFLKCGQSGIFIGGLVGWDRYNEAMVVELNSATIHGHGN
ncbi:hypothetical protein PGT21_030497 [Puccinia graminis f. sp. tritici]|uniref:Uncharacterized protein n=1 Tax=Puccinia graminis f. sp. tritici TaxID=56615 RepID=A0A5B0MXU6_PUCGR|nr:hypothetical protein PGT21_030497 [Puccinia graminis f. sp. tritici]